MGSMHTISVSSLSWDSAEGFDVVIVVLVFVLESKAMPVVSVSTEHYYICQHYAAKGMMGKRSSCCAVYPSDADGFMGALNSVSAALNPSQRADGNSLLPKQL